MASVYSSEYWTGDYTYTRVRVDYSGTSATAHLLFTRTNYWSGQTYCNGATFSFGGASVGFNASSYGHQEDLEVASVSFTISTAGGTYSGSTNNATLYSFSGSVTIPAQSSGPTGLSAENLVPESEGFTATVKITGWGTGGSTSQRRKELQAWVYNPSALSLPRKYASVSENTLSTVINVTNNSLAVDEASSSGQLLKLVGNTRYTLAIYATNGAASTGSMRWRDAVTLPYKPVVILENVSKNSANFTIDIKKDGGFYEKFLYYSLDGTNWTFIKKISTGDAESVPLTISALSANTSYNLQVKLVSTAGEIQNGGFTFYTQGDTAAFYASDSTQRASNTEIFYSENNNLVTTNTKKIYASVNGRADLVLNRSTSRTARPKLPLTSYGRVYYKPTTSSTKIESVELQSVAEFESLCSTSSSTYSWTATVGATPVTLSSRGDNCIIGIDIGTEITTIPDFFLYGCSYYYGDLIVPNNVTTIGTYFASRCGNSNNKLSVVNLGKNVTSLGTYCLAYSYFQAGSVVTMPGEITAIPNYFMYYAYDFNSPLTISPKATSIGTYFLSNCSSFNSSITFNPVLTTIGSSFLRTNTSYNNDITLPTTLTSIGAYFLYQCNAMASTVNVRSLAATVITSSNYSLSTNSSSAAMYTTGVKIAGQTRADWITRLPDRTSSPYRKLLNAGY